MYAGSFCGGTAKCGGQVPLDLRLTPFGMMYKGLYIEEFTSGRRIELGLIVRFSGERGASSLLAFGKTA